jgi:hypothetical protein
VKGFSKLAHILLEKFQTKKHEQRTRGILNFFAMKLEQLSTRNEDFF